MLYGIYTVLFGLTMWILPRKFHISPVKRFIFPTIIARFLLATLNIFYDLVGEVYAVLDTIPPNERPWMIAGQSIDLATFVLADILGDAILLYRVYTLWGPRKWILLPLVLVMLTTKLLSIIAVIIRVLALDDPRKYEAVNVKVSDDFRIWFSFILSNVCMNTLMTLLIAGRVWWISRCTQSGTFTPWFNRTLAIVTESGVIYPLILILILSLNPPNYSCTGTIATGLAPTLIAVRVGLGSSFDDEITERPIVDLESVKARENTYVPEIGPFNCRASEDFMSCTFNSATEGPMDDTFGGCIVETLHRFTESVETVQS